MGILWTKRIISQGIRKSEMIMRKSDGLKIVSVDKGGSKRVWKSAIQTAKNLCCFFSEIRD